MRRTIDRRGAGGFSLIEVLVSMFVVSMGILALAGLLQAAARYGKMSELRSTATLLAADIADRIRVNAAVAPGYDLVSRSYPTTVVTGRAACSSSAPCQPADLVHADLAAWTARLRATLPNGSAYLKYHAGVAPARDAVDVWVGWTDPNTVAAGLSTERPGTECPPDWRGTDSAVRCIYLQVGL